MRFWVYAEVVENWVRKDVPVLAGLPGEYEETTKVLSIRDADPSSPGIVLGGTYKVRINENLHSVSFRCVCTAIEGRTFLFLLAVPLTEPPVPPKPEGEPKEVKRDPPLEDPEIKKRYEKRIAEEDKQKAEAEKREAQRAAAEAAKQAEIEAFFKRKAEEAKEAEPDVDPTDEEPDLVTDVDKTEKEEIPPTEEPDAAELERLAAEEAQRIAAGEAQRLADEEAQRLADEEAQRAAAQAEQEAERIAAEEAAREAAQEAADRAVEIEELARQSASASASATASASGGSEEQDLADKVMQALEMEDGGSDDEDAK